VAGPAGNPPLTRNCEGENLPRGSAKNFAEVPIAGRCPERSAANCPKPGNFGIRVPWGRIIFFLASRKEPEKSRVSIPVFYGTPKLLRPALRAADDSGRIPGLLFFGKGVTMFFFNSRTKRSLTQRTLILAALFLLVAAALFFAGCPMEDGDDSTEADTLPDKLIGTWADQQGGDSYVLSADRVAYDNGFGGGYAGTVEYINEFTEAAGVIIIKYDPDKKNKYYSDVNHYGEPEYEIAPPGDYIGIYYKELTAKLVKTGAAYGAEPPEKATLKEAKASFTEDNEGTYMTWYGTYTWQK
jgi:preprotein translocase subunit SecG